MLRNSKWSHIYADIQVKMLERVGGERVTNGISFPMRLYALCGIPQIECNSSSNISTSSSSNIENENWVSFFERRNLRVRSRRSQVVPHGITLHRLGRIHFFQNKKITMQKNPDQKKLVNSDKSISRNFLSTKFQFLPFQKWPKIHF